MAKSGGGQFLHHLKLMHDRKSFLTNPKVLENYSLLKELEVFSHIESLQREIVNYEGILKAAADILHRTSIDEILETTVRQISEKILPSFLVFLWRPLKGKESLVVKGYKNFRSVELRLDLPGIEPFEAFFKNYPRPISYDLLAFQLDNTAVTAALEVQKPEIVMPIIGPSGLYGLILIGPKMLVEQYTPQELAFLDKLMSFTSLAIQNHLHYEHSVRDVKTGLFNHGYFMNRMDDEIARAKRLNHAFSVIVLDVDKFKNFNDAFGHLAGDRVLEHIAASILASVRVQDIPSRFGGEEFMVLLPETGRAGAWVAAERIREAVAAMQVPWETALPRVTISAGISVYEQDSAVDADELLKRADSAMYQSKTRGRNRSSVWGAGLLFRTEQFAGRKGTE